MKDSCYLIENNNVNDAGCYQYPKNAKGKNLVFFSTDPYYHEKICKVKSPDTTYFPNLRIFYGGVGENDTLRPPRLSPFYSTGL